MPAPTSGLMAARRQLATPAGFTLLGALLAAVALAVTRVLATTGVTRTVAVLVVVLGSTWFACTRRTSLALAMLMLYLGLLDSYLKLTSGSSYVTLVRDVLLFAMVAGMLVRSQVDGRRLSLPPLSGWVIAYVVFVLVQIPNPNGGTLSHSLAGLRPHLEFVPLFFLGYVAVRDVAGLRRFVLLLLVIGAANGIVSFFQFQLTPEQLAAWGPGYAQRVLGTGSFSGGGRSFADAVGVNRVRPFGLGSDAGDGGIFGVLALGGAFALAGAASALRYRLLGALLGVGAVAAIITSQGKAVVVAGLVTVVAYAALTATSRRRLSGLAALAVVAALSYFIVPHLVPNPGGNAYRYQGLSTSKILTTVSQERPAQLHNILSAITNYPLGAGLGTGGPAAGQAGASSLVLNSESEFSFLDLEAGIPGLMALAGFTFVLLGVGFARCRREPDPEARALLAAVISPIAGILVDYYVGPFSVSVPDGPFLWFAAGLVSYWLFTRPRERTGELARL